jgi:hypothetical protein
MKYLLGILLVLCLAVPSFAWTTTSLFVDENNSKYLEVVGGYPIGIGTLQVFGDKYEGTNYFATVDYQIGYLKVGAVIVPGVVTKRIGLSITF